jgi:hypothetical protein
MAAAPFLRLHARMSAELAAAHRQRFMSQPVWPRIARYQEVMCSSDQLRLKESTVGEVMDSFDEFDPATRFAIWLAFDAWQAGCFECRCV